MFSHIMVGTADIERAKRFYDAVLGVLGAAEGQRSTNATGQQRVFWRHAGASFGVTEPIDGQPPSVANGSTIGLACDSPEQVNAWHEAALAHGGRAIEHPPGVRQHAVGALYLAYVRDPDGHKLCALYRVKAAG